MHVRATDIRTDEGPLVWSRVPEFSIAYNGYSVVIPYVEADYSTRPGRRVVLLFLERDRQSLRLSTCAPEPGGLPLTPPPAPRVVPPSPAVRARDIGRPPSAAGSWVGDAR
jgi:hypothetical protein